MEVAARLSYLHCSLVDVISCVFEVYDHEWGALWHVCFDKIVVFSMETLSSASVKHLFELKHTTNGMLLHGGRQTKH